MEHIIDASGKKIGRIASVVAALLIGKNTPHFARNIVPSVKVKVINASKVIASEKKRATMVYTKYSGYPGGLHTETLGHLMTRRGHGEVLRRAVFGMLPKNKLRSRFIKNLILTD